MNKVMSRVLLVLRLLAIVTPVTALVVAPAIVSTEALAQNKKLSETGFGTQNFIINGNFDFWQRGVGPTQFSTNTYMADRWKAYENLATGTATQERSADVPASALSAKYSAKITVTATQPVVDPGEISMYMHYIEGYNAKLLYGKTVTLSFWVKSTLAGTWSMIIRNNGANRILPKLYTINAANTWERKTITWYQDPTGTWEKEELAGIHLVWGLSVGTTFQCAPDVWASGSCLAATGHPNFFQATGGPHSLYLAQVMLNTGDRAAPFALAGGDVQGEYAKCLRYHWRPAYKDNTNPNVRFAMCQAISTIIARCGMPLPVTMRITPTGSGMAQGGTVLTNGTVQVGWNTFSVQTALSSPDYVVFEIGASSYSPALVAGQTVFACKGLASDNFDWDAEL